jgi:hypothetical protein
MSQCLYLGGKVYVLTLCHLPGWGQESSKIQCPLGSFCVAEHLPPELRTTVPLNYLGSLWPQPPTRAKCVPREEERVIGDLRRHYAGLRNRPDTVLESPDTASSSRAGGDDPSEMPEIVNSIHASSSRAVDENPLKRIRIGNPSHVLSFDEKLRIASQASSSRVGNENALQRPI